MLGSAGQVVYGVYQKRIDAKVMSQKRIDAKVMSLKFICRFY